MNRALPGFFVWCAIYGLSCKVVVVQCITQDDLQITLYFCLLCLSYVVLAFALKNDWRILIPCLVVTIIAVIWMDTAIHTMYLQARLIEPGDAPLTSQRVALDTSIAVVPATIIRCFLPRQPESWIAALRAKTRR